MILRTGHHDVAWSRHRTVEEVIDALEHLRDRISDGDSSARRERKALCLPTGAIDEIAISSGWADT